MNVAVSLLLLFQCLSVVECSRGRAVLRRRTGLANAADSDADDTSGAGDKSHDTAYNSIISKYYTTDPFFGNAEPSGAEAAGSDAQAEDAPDVRARQKALMTNSRIPAPLMVRDEVAPLNQIHNVQGPESRSSPDGGQAGIPAPLLVGGGERKQLGSPHRPSSQQYPRVRMHVKKRKKSGESKPLFRIKKKTMKPVKYVRTTTTFMPSTTTTEAPLPESKRPQRHISEEVMKSTHRPERQAFSQLLPQEQVRGLPRRRPSQAPQEFHKTQEQQNPRQKSSESTSSSFDFGPTSGIGQAFGSPFSSQQQEDEGGFLKEAPPGQFGEIFPGDLRGDIPELPDVGEGEQPKNIVKAGELGGPRSTTYFDLMGDFFPKPELNLYKELRPGRPGAGVIGSPPQEDEEGNSLEGEEEFKHEPRTLDPYPEEGNTFEKETEREVFKRQYKVTPEIDHPPKAYYQDKYEDLKPHQPTTPVPISQLAYKPKSHQSYSQYHHEKKPYHHEKKPYHHEKKPYQHEKKPYHHEKKPYHYEKEPYHNEREPYHHEKKPYQHEKASPVIVSKLKPLHSKPGSYHHEPKTYHDQPNPYHEQPKPYKPEPNPYKPEPKPLRYLPKKPAHPVPEAPPALKDSFTDEPANIGAPDMPHRVNIDDYFGVGFGESPKKPKQSFYPLPPSPHQDPFGAKVPGDHFEAFKNDFPPLYHEDSSVKQDHHKTPVGHPYAPPPAHHNPLDVHHKPEHVEAYQPKKMPHAGEHFTPDNYHVELPKMNIGNAFGGEGGMGAGFGSGFPGFANGPDGSGSPDSGSFFPMEGRHKEELDAATPFSNLKIEGNLVPMEVEHRGLPEVAGPVLPSPGQGFGHTETRPGQDFGHIETSHGQGFGQTESSFGLRPSDVKSLKKRPSISFDRPSPQAGPSFGRPSPNAGPQGNFGPNNFYPGPEKRDTRRPAPRALPLPSSQTPPAPQTKQVSAPFPEQPESEESDFSMPQLGPPLGFLQVTRDAQFPVDVPKLGSKVPYQPPELFFDAIHSGENPDTMSHHNHVKKDVMSSNAQPKTSQAEGREEVDSYNPYDQFSPRESQEYYPEEPRDKIKFKPRPSNNKEKLSQYLRKEEEKKAQHRPIKMYQPQEYNSQSQFSSSGPSDVDEPEMLPSPQPLVQQYKPIQPYQPPLQQYTEPQEYHSHQEGREAKGRSIPQPSAESEEDFMPSPEEFFRGLDRPANFDAFSSQMPDSFEVEKIFPSSMAEISGGDPYQEKEALPPVYSGVSGDFDQPREFPSEDLPAISERQDTNSYQSESRVENPFSAEEPEFYQYGASTFSDRMGISFGEDGDEEEELLMDHEYDRPLDLLAQEGTEKESNRRSADYGRALFGVEDDTQILYPESKVESPHQFTHVDGHNKFKAGHNRGHHHHHIQDAQDRHGHRHKQEVSPRALVCTMDQYNTFNLQHTIV